MQTIQSSKYIHRPAWEHL